MISPWLLQFYLNFNLSCYFLNPWVFSPSRYISPKCHSLELFSFCKTKDASFQLRHILRRNGPICRNVFSGSDLSGKGSTPPLFNKTSYLLDFCACVFMLFVKLCSPRIIHLRSGQFTQSMSCIWNLPESHSKIFWESEISDETVFRNL